MSRRSLGLTWLLLASLPWTLAGAQEPQEEPEPSTTLVVPPVATGSPSEENDAPVSPPPQDESSTASTDTSAPPPVTDPGEAFVMANTAYEAGQYAEAVRLYSSVAEAGEGNGHLFYNLGNAYLRNGELGRSIAAYRQAQALLPRDQDLAANLAFARQTTRDALAPPGPSAIQQALFFWHYRLSRAELLRGLVVANLVFWLALGCRRLWRRSEVLRWLVMVSFVVVVALAASLAVRWLHPARVAVVVPQEISAHSGTSENTVLRFRLQAGTEVRMLERRDGWLRIALPDGQQAWIQADHAEVVVL